MAQATKIAKSYWHKNFAMLRLSCLQVAWKTIQIIQTSPTPKQTKTRKGKKKQTRKEEVGKEISKKQKLFKCRRNPTREVKQLTEDLQEESNSKCPLKMMGRSDWKVDALADTPAFTVSKVNYGETYITILH